METQQKYFSTENLTENKLNLMVIWQKQLTYTQSTEYYTRDILLNENIRISEKVIEIRAIYLHTQCPRSAVHSVGST